MMCRYCVHAEEIEGLNFKCHKQEMGGKLDPYDCMEYKPKDMSAKDAAILLIVGTIIIIGCIIILI